MTYCGLCGTPGFARKKQMQCVAALDQLSRSRVCFVSSYRDHIGNLAKSQTRLG